MRARDTLSPSWLILLLRFYFSLLNNPELKTSSPHKMSFEVIIMGKVNFVLANKSAILSKPIQIQIEALINKLERENTFKSISKIEFDSISNNSFSVEVTPNSKGWTQKLSDKICKELELNHLKDIEKNRLFEIN
jgi:hypothetical protein